jgi:hypothetical protein
MTALWSSHFWLLSLCSAALILEQAGMRVVQESPT